MPRLALHEAKKRLRAVGCTVRFDGEVLWVTLPGAGEPSVIEPVWRKVYSPKTIAHYERMANRRPR